MAESPATIPSEASVRPSLARLFRELFLISACVLGGGYAILLVADDIFGRKLKWLRPGELLERLSLFQMVPGLIAGNTAIYVGWKIAGRVGSAVGLFAVALPSYAVFLAVSCGYGWLPVENPVVAGALLGLRAAMTGLLAGTLLRGWRRAVQGVYGYAVLAAASLLLVLCGTNPAWVLVGAMALGVCRRFMGFGVAAPDVGDAPDAAVRSETARVRLAGRLAAVAVALGAAALACTQYRTFVKFGFLCFGGGFPLVTLYVREFVGDAAPLLQLPLEQFSNVIALTQATPGPVSVNAATFFGHRLGGAFGAACATAALLAPSFLLLTAALSGLARWRNSRVVQGIVAGVRPATSALLVSAGVTFASMSVWNAAAGWRFSPFACCVAVGVAACVVRGRIPVMALVFAGALLGVMFGLAA